MKKTKESNWMYVWLFVIGAFIGFILETLFYYFKNGIWINKQGLLYGPFKPIYGFGLILIVLVLKNYQDKKLWQKLLVGILIGSSFEYLGSLFQEYVFGTSTWNYSNFNYNISGRIYLPYCLAWGIIAVISIDILYPFIKKTLSKINEKVYYAEIDLSKFVKYGKNNKKYTPIPKYPAVERDIALVVDEQIEVGQIENIISKKSKNILETAKLFDIYRNEKLGQNKKSVAYELIFRANNRTLTDDEIKNTMEAITKELQVALGAELRT